ncbi:MAG: alcohol dehydrogenase catalytic domain-containing protein [Rhodobacteraceae bacterium]|nr:alcohol dehydrogenase catalytic domain-containing protein [Paracoccaceae bacterium]
MRAAVLIEPGRFDVQMVPCPQPESSEVLIRIARTGICGTDLHIFHGNYAAERLPMIPGHEFCGHVEKLGANVTGLHEGQAVVVDMNIGCMRCYWCRRNEILNCPEMQQIGITVDGAFAEYIAVPSDRVIPVPNDISVATLALAEPLACVIRAARKAQITFGESAVVIGAGPIGNLHVQLLRTIGAAPIIASDISPKRITMAKTVGADFVIESVGDPSLYADAKALLRKGGHLVAFGLTGPGETLELDILQTILEENSIKGSVAGMGQDMHDAVTLLCYNRINTEPFIRANYALEDIQNVFETITERPQDLKTQIVM